MTVKSVSPIHRISLGKNRALLLFVTVSLGIFTQCLATDKLSPRSSLAEMPDLETRSAEADIIVLCDVKNVRSAAYIKGADSVQAQLDVVEYLKGTTRSPINLSFLVFPYSVENHMTRPPQEGRYIVFLKWQAVTDKDGRTGNALVLIDPKPFSLVYYTESRLKDVKQILNIP